MGNLGCLPLAQCKGWVGLFVFLMSGTTCLKGKIFTRSVQQLILGAAG